MEAAGKPVDSTIDLRADGTASFSLTAASASADLSADGVWVLTDGGAVTVDLGGQQTGVVTLNGGQLTMTLKKSDGSVVYYFYSRS